jgi:hypothetical protein
VQRAIQETGLRVVQYSDAIAPRAELTSTILHAIRSADLIIPDVRRQNRTSCTKSGLRALFENRQSCWSASTLARISPAIFAGLQYILYDSANVSRLAELVKAETKALTMLRSA